jgi:hypothetical protein
MRLSRLIGVLCAVCLPLLTALSHAALIDRGGGLIYDTVLDITWLQDTNYALTNGDDDGRMTWTEANAWAAGLSYYDVVRDVTYDDWRLPTMSPIDGNSFNTTISNDGTTDLGFARTTTDGSDGGWRDSSGTPVSELGYMYYVNLGNFGKCDPDLPGCTTTTRNWGLNYTGPFTNFSHITIESILGRYATSTDFFNEIDAGLSGDYSFNFNITNGEQVLKRKDTGFGNLAAWAVRDGDVALDSDADGLFDSIEDGDGNGIVDTGETDPFNPDSDGDGLLDGAEDSNGNGIVDAGETDPLNPDGDGDGLFDGEEDSNGNGIVDAGETDPFNPDSDGDGLLDGAEDSNGNGIVDAGESDPTDSDSDSDGLSDGYEVNIIASDPTSPTIVYTNPGDMNADGAVNTGDLLLLQRQILGL